MFREPQSNTNSTTSPQLFTLSMLTLYTCWHDNNEKATRAQRICAARAEQMQIENYSCIVITPIQVTGWVWLILWQCVGFSTRSVQIAGQTTKSGLKRSSFVTLSLHHFRCPVRHNEQTSCKSQIHRRASRQSASSTGSLVEAEISSASQEIDAFVNIYWIAILLSMTHSPSFWRWLLFTVLFTVEPSFHLFEQSSKLFFFVLTRPTTPTGIIYVCFVYWLCHLQPCDQQSIIKQKTQQQQQQTQKQPTNHTSTNKQKTRATNTTTH